MLSTFVSMIGRYLPLLLLCGSAAAAAGQIAPVSARTLPLALPSAIAFDTAGDLYLAEAQGHSIRRVDTTGAIVRVAGDGSQGFSGDGGPATAAQLDSPQGLAVDPAGNVFLADSGNNRIRRIDAVTGTIQTMAGSGARGFAGDGGPALAAALNLPRALCLDATGTQLYIADSRNHRIRHVDLAAGTVETVAGNGTEGLSGDGGPAISAALDSPEGIALDTAGNLLIADTHNGRIRRVDASTHIISTVVSGVALPRGVTADAAGNLFLPDTARHRVLRIDHATGALSTAAGEGTEGYAGDGGAATAALLDGPRAVAISPGGLLTVTDSANGRVRQLLAAPAAATPIQTIAGLGVTVPGVLALVAPSVEAYGSATVTATLRAGDAATGQVTFFEAGSAANAALGTATLAGNAATLSLPALPAGAHRLIATYAGDATHGSAQTPVLALTVAPLNLSVAATAASMTYGTAPPTLGGTVDGLLAQDAGSVTASFGTTVTAASPAGSYPITVSLAGPAAGNYTPQMTGANLTVMPAASSLALSNLSTDGSFSGTLQAVASSSTTGTPTGSVTLLDNGVALLRTPLGTGTALFSVATLAAGTHLLTATYSGDGNFLPSTSAALSASIAAPPSADFSIASGTSSQTLTAGGSVTYTLTVQPSGAALNSPIQLAVTGLPAFTTASFSPSYIPPGGMAGTAVVLTVSSQASASNAQAPRELAPVGRGPRGRVPAVLALAAAVPLLGSLAARRRLPTLAALLLLCGALLPLSGCGDRIYPNPSDPGTTLHSYTLSVTGTATGATGATLQHAATVTLETITKD